MQISDNKGIDKYLSGIFSMIIIMIIIIIIVAFCIWKSF